MSGGGISTSLMSLIVMPRSFRALKISRNWLENRLGTATRLAAQVLEVVDVGILAHHQGGAVAVAEEDDLARDALLAQRHRHRRQHEGRRRVAGDVGLLQLGPAAEAHRLEQAAAVHVLADPVGDGAGEVAGHRQEAHLELHLLGHLLAEPDGAERVEPQVQPRVGEAERDGDDNRAHHDPGQLAQFDPPSEQERTSYAGAGVFSLPRNHQKTTSERCAPPPNSGQGAPTGRNGPRGGDERPGDQDHRINASGSVRPDQCVCAQAYWVTPAVCSENRVSA